MGEKSLLVELKKEEKKIVEKKLAEVCKSDEKKQTQSAESKKQEIKKYDNAFSSKSFKGLPEGEIYVPKLDDIRAKAEKEKQELSEEQEIAKLESKVSATIEKPNYDYIETLSDSQREKIFKIERDAKVAPKTKPGKLKAVVFCILFAIFGVWGIVNITQIDSIGGQIAEVASEYYNINLPKYLKNLVSLDATNSENMENLFETIPEEDVSPSEVIEKSNWFDRFCNFIAGLFGG